MIFFSKRSPGTAHSSSSEACISILGLFIAIGLLGGLSTLIYGLIKGSSSGIIGGGVVLGVSVVCGVILALVFACCLKNNDTDSNGQEQGPSSHHPPRKHNRRQPQNRQGNHELTTTHEITHVSAVQRYDHHRQQQPNGYDVQMLSHSNGLTDSTNSQYGKQAPASPSKISSSIQLNQSHSSVNNSNQQFPINSNTNRTNYNRH